MGIGVFFFEDLNFFFELTILRFQNIYLFVDDVSMGVDGILYTILFNFEFVFELLNLFFLGSHHVFILVPLFFHLLFQFLDFRDGSSRGYFSMVYYWVFVSFVFDLRLRVHENFLAFCKVIGFDYFLIFFLHYFILFYFLL